MEDLEYWLCKKGRKFEIIILNFDAKPNAFLAPDKKLTVIQCTDIFRQTLDSTYLQHRRFVFVECVL